MSIFDHHCFDPHPWNEKKDTNMRFAKLIKIGTLVISDEVLNDSVGNSSMMNSLVDLRLVDPASYKA